MEDELIFDNKELSFKDVLNYFTILLLNSLYIERERESGIIHRIIFVFILNFFPYCTTSIPIYIYFLRKICSLSF